jgi:hypothetical protein
MSNLSNLTGMQISIIILAVIVAGCVYAGWRGTVGSRYNTARHARSLTDDELDQVIFQATSNGTYSDAYHIERDNRMTTKGA